MGRAGQSVEFQRTLFFVFAAITIGVAFAFFTGPGFGIIGGTMDDISRKSDQTRTQGAVSQLRGVGSGGVQLTYDREYKRIELASSGTVTMKVAGKKSFSYALPSRFSYVSNTISGRDICVRKQGLTYSFSKGGCPPSNCVEGTCEAATVTRNGEVVPRWGYTCENQVYTDTKFFTRYYKNKCGNVDGAKFAHLNRVACSAEGGSSTCMAVASWRCAKGAGDVTVKLSGPTGDTTLLSRQCQGLGSARASGSVSLPTTRAGVSQWDVTVTIQTPDTSSSVTRTVQR